MTIAWVDLSPQQRLLLVALGSDLVNEGSVGTELTNLMPQLQTAAASLRLLGLVEATRSSHVGIWLRITRVGRIVREQGRLR